MTAPLSALLLAAFLSTPAVGVARAPVSATQAHEVVVEGSARNRAKAKRSAERRLRSIELPPGAAMSLDRPTGVGELLSEAVATPGGRPRVTAHRFWTIPLSAREVLTWLRRHAQQAARRVGEIGGSSGSSIEFETPPGPVRDAGGLLYVTVVPRTTGGSAVRADVFEAWEIPRSPLERIPAGSRFLRLSVVPGTEGSYLKSDEVPPSRTISTKIGAWSRGWSGSSTANLHTSWSILRAAGPPPALGGNPA